jgi:hypothetical protein
MDAATVIEIPTPFDAPTLLGAPIVELPYRPVASPQAPKSNWSESLLLPTGTVLGNRYEILQLLGQGGMGAVYKARDNELDRIIALKVIRPELASNPEILQRFKQEWSLPAKLQTGTSFVFSISAKRTEFASSQWSMWKERAYTT